MKEKNKDRLLIATIAAGMFWPPLMLSVALNSLIKFDYLKIKIPIGYLVLALSVALGGMVALYRGTDGNEKALIQFIANWGMPFVFLGYTPGGFTKRRVAIFLSSILILDLSFNLYSYFSGGDIFGRTLDMRDGVSGTTRMGGIFAHSFYSGTISLLAYIYAMQERGFKIFCAIAALNMILAGSFRFIIPILTVPIFFIGWKNRTRIREFFMIAVISVAAVFSVIETSSVGHLDLPENPANNLRIIAWTSAIKNVSASPMYGLGYSDARVEEINEQVIREKLISESWYLKSALAFGLPYLILRLAGLLIIFYGSRFSSRSALEAMLVPITIIDFTYGDAFDGLLYSAIFWLSSNFKR